MGRKEGHKRIEFLLDPNDAKEAAIGAWIDQQKGEHDSLKAFMLAVLEWAMTGEQVQAVSAATAPSVTVNIDQNAFVPIADAVGRSVGEAVRAAYTDVQRMTALEPPKANAQWRTDD